MHRIFRDLLAPQVAEGREKGNEAVPCVCGSGPVAQEAPVVPAQSFEQKLAVVPISHAHLNLMGY